MSEIYGDAWDCTDQVRELCLNCKYPDCFGDDGCLERRKMVAKLKAIDAAWAYRNGAFTTRGKMYKIGDEEKTLSEWCKVYGQKYNNVWTRMQCGATIEEALNTNTRRGGDRNRGIRVEINGEFHCMNEWLRICHMHRLTVVRYSQKHKCTMREALKILCEKKLKKLLV